VAEPGGSATFLLSEELVKPGPEGRGGGGEAEFPVQEGAAADAEAAGELVLGQTSLQALGLQQGGERSGGSGPGWPIGSEGGQGQAAKRSRNPPLPPALLTDSGAPKVRFRRRRNRRGDGPPVHRFLDCCVAYPSVANRLTG